MSSQLVKIHPPELIFTFELKKQSSCVIHLANGSDQYVAFKVKTTSPKKYCVRPNIGVIMPKSTSDFTVTMQAQRSAPPDMQCKDKFLIQSTVVSFGTTEEDITPDLFAKDSGKHLEEYKLRVVLVSPSHSPVLLPINGVLKNEPSYESSTQKDILVRGAGNLPPPSALVKDVEDVNNAMFMEGTRPTMIVDEDKGSSVHSAMLMEGTRPAMVVEEDKGLSPAKDVEQRPVQDVERIMLALSKEAEDLKLKMNVLDSKLIEAEVAISKLKEEKSITIQEKETLKQELASLSRNSSVRRVQKGFPFLFVCMVALISLTLGYLMHL